MHVSKFAFVIVFLLANLVKADTEIRNFHFPIDTTVIPALLEFDGPSPDTIRTLTASGDLRLHVSDLHPDVWIRLDMSEKYEAHKAWTMRLSWPGSSPTKFTLTTYSYSDPYTQHSSNSQPHSHSYSHSQPRDSLLLHITATALSPRFPRPVLPHRKLVSALGDGAGAGAGADFDSDSGSITGPKHVDFDSDSDLKPKNPFITPIHIIFEPLHFGVLPQTALRAVLWIIIFALGAGMVVPRIYRAVEVVLAWSILDSTGGEKEESESVTDMDMEQERLRRRAR